MEEEKREENKPLTLADLKEFTIDSLTASECFIESRLSLL
jgi:hypothetical protein